MQYPDVSKVVLKFTGASGLADKSIHLPTVTVERISPLNLFRFESSRHGDPSKIYEILIKRYGDECIEFLLVPTENDVLKRLEGRIKKSEKTVKIVYSSGEVEARQFSCLPKLGDNVSFNKLQYDVQQCCWVLADLVYSWKGPEIVHVCEPILYLANCSVEKPLSFMHNVPTVSSGVESEPSRTEGIRVRTFDNDARVITVDDIYQQRIEREKTALKTYKSQLSRDLKTEFSFNPLQERRKRRAAHLGAFKAASALSHLLPVPGLHIIVTKALQLSANKYMARCVENDSTMLADESQTSLRRMEAATHLKYKQDSVALIPLYWETLSKYQIVAKSIGNHETAHFQLAARLARLEKLKDDSLATLNDIDDDCVIMREDLERRAIDIKYKLGLQRTHTVVRSPLPRRGGWISPISGPESQPAGLLRQGDLMGPTPSPTGGLPLTPPWTPLTMRRERSGSLASPRPGASSRSPLPEIGDRSGCPLPPVFQAIKQAPPSPERPKTKRPSPLRVSRLGSRLP